jgi:hypothetical protein
MKAYAGNVFVFVFVALILTVAKWLGVNNWFLGSLIVLFGVIPVLSMVFSKIDAALMHLASIDSRLQSIDSNMESSARSLSEIEFNTSAIQEEIHAYMVENEYPAGHERYQWQEDSNRTE